MIGGVLAGHPTGPRNGDWIKMAKKELGPGRKHVDELGLESVPTYQRLQKDVRKKFGKVGVETLDLMGEVKVASSRYIHKNKRFDLAMFISGAYDRSIIMNACDWIDQNKELFGETILEIGCDMGFMTTFLAKTFPDRKIVSIDRNQKGIDFARINCERLGIRNVEFKCTCLNDLDDIHFDTVFTMRVAQENMGSVVEDPMDEFPELSERFAKSLEGYCKKLRTLIGDSGNIISIEKIHMDALFGGYVRAMSRAGLKGNDASHKEVKCTELDIPVVLQCMEFVPSKEDIVDLNVLIDCFVHHISMTEAQYLGWDAKIMLPLIAKKLQCGYEIVPKSDGDRCRVAMFIRKCDETCLILYIHREAYVKMECYDISSMDYLISMIQDIVKDAVSCGRFNVTTLIDWPSMLYN